MRRRYLPDRVTEQRHPYFFLLFALSALAGSFFIIQPLWQTLYWLSLATVSTLTGSVPAGLQLRAQIMFAAFTAFGCLPTAIDIAADPTNSILHLWGNSEISRSGIALFLRVFLRCMGAITGTLFIAYNIPIAQLSRMIRRAGIPPLAADIFDFTYRYIFILLEVAENILIAMRCRFGFEQRSRRIEQSALLVGQTLTLANDDLERQWRGLLSRRFNETVDGYKKQRLQMNETFRIPPGITPGNTLLEGRDLSFRYDDEPPVLQNLDLAIQPGEKILLLGNNGSGKSTLFYLLSGILRPTAGSLLLNNREISFKGKSLHGLRHTVGLVFQNSNHQLFTPSVEDEIAFGLRNLNYPEDEVSSRVKDQLTRFNLHELRHRPPHLLSEGQKKWVALAAVLILRPKLLILDEPTAGLDQCRLGELLSIVEELRQTGCAILIATHEESFSKDWADRCLRLADGRISIVDDKHTQCCTS